MRFSLSRRPAPDPDWLVVGLGNPGPVYAGTRHNVGFRVIDRLAETHGIRLRRERQSSLGRGRIDGVEVILLKPLTFMNLSGRAIAPLAQRHSLESGRVLVVCDDLDLPTGRIRVRARGSAGGHNGLKSTIDCLQSQDFPRVRIGVGRPAEGDAIDHVLGSFTREEREIFENAISRAAEAVEVVLSEGIEAAMNRFNAASA